MKKFPAMLVFFCSAFLPAASFAADDGSNTWLQLAPLSTNGIITRGRDHGETEKRLSKFETVIDARLRQELAILGAKYPKLTRGLTLVSRSEFGTRYYWHEQRYGCEKYPGIYKELGDRNCGEGMNVLVEDFDPLTVVVFTRIEALESWENDNRLVERWDRAYRYEWTAFGWKYINLVEEIKMWEEYSGKARRLLAKSSTTGRTIDVSRKLDNLGLGRSFSTVERTCPDDGDIFLELERIALRRIQTTADKEAGPGSSWALIDVEDMVDCQGRPSLFSHTKENGGLYVRCRTSWYCRAMEIFAKEPLRIRVYYKYQASSRGRNSESDEYSGTDEYVRSGNEWKFAGQTQLVRRFTAEDKWGFETHFYQCRGSDRAYQPDEAENDKMVKDGLIVPRKVPANRR